MRTAIAVALAGVAICLAAPTAPAAAAPDNLFGITKGGLSPDDQDIDKMESTGVRTFRLALDWPSLQPSPDPPHFGGIDRLVGDLAARGIRPVPFVYGSPSWVAKRPNRPPLGSARKEQAWRQFLALAVKRYGPGGIYWTGGAYQGQHPGASPKPITAWQIWNEPNLPKYFSANHITRKYAELVKISNRAITGVDPRAKVVLAGLTGYAKPRGWNFLDSLYRVNGIKQHFDVAALHPYAATIDQFRTELHRVRGVIRRHHDARTPLWLTEVGWGSAQNRYALNKGLRGQKRMLKRSFTLVLNKRRAWNIKRLFWFDWRDPRRGATANCSFCDSAGLLKHNREPKPAYRAFRRFAR
jgi:hypothetical protein